ncbi:MAG: hypothetical protein MJZ10_08055 [Fibrobacter sp.]|nr:hypothetical protein [Fibrobacter sp.]
MKKTCFILAIIAAATLVAYFNLPIRFFIDGVFPFECQGSVVVYDDRSDGGASVVSSEADESSIRFTCALGESEKGGWCGILFDLRKKDEAGFANRDWSFVDSVIVDLEAEGTSEILLKLWAFDPVVTDTNVARTYRLLMKELPLVQGRQRVSIPMDQFYTPEFWYSDNRVDTSLVDRHQEAMVRLEIAPGWNQPHGKPFSLKIYKIEAKGLSNKVFGGVLFIMLVLTIVAVGRKHSVHHD